MLHVGIFLATSHIPLVAATGFQHAVIAITVDIRNIIKSNGIASCIGIWMVDAVTYSGLCHKIQYNIWFIRLKPLSNQRFICSISFYEFIYAFPSRLCTLISQKTFFFKPWIIIPIQNDNRHYKRFPEFHKTLCTKTAPMNPGAPAIRIP